MDKKIALDTFGKLLVEQARDKAIWHYDHIISGQLKGDYAQEIRDKLISFEAKQLEVLEELIPDIVDIAIASVLWMVDQEWIDISLRTDAGIVPSIREISDGVEGDLYGWIPRFSKHS